MARREASRQTLLRIIRVLVTVFGVFVLYRLRRK